jgi:hypothetical protein
MKCRFAPLLAALLVAGTTTGAMACVEHRRFAESLGFASRAFVGTVVGYRLSDSSLARSAPSCTLPDDDPQLSAECAAFWHRVVSIQYDVETAVAGIEPNRKYETGVWNPDGCVPQIGERWLTSGWYRDDFSMKLDGPPSAAQIEEWRRIAADQ